MIHEFPNKSMSSECPQPHHVGFLVLDRMPNVVPD